MVPLVPAIKLLLLPIYISMIMKNRSTCELCPSPTTISFLDNLGWKNGILESTGRPTKSPSIKPNYKSRNYLIRPFSQNAKPPKLQDTTSLQQKTLPWPLENKS